MGETNGCPVCFLDCRGAGIVPQQHRGPSKLEGATTLCIYRRRLEGGEPHSDILSGSAQKG
jgi:hypothetical protein